MHVQIYQIKVSDNTEDMNILGRVFRGYDEVIKRFGPITNAVLVQFYDMVYEYDIKLENENVNPRAILNEIWTKFNIDHPDNFRGHSLSVSDIVKLDDKYYYCDSFGWKDLSL